ncbi:hypothetical protein [Lactobacillus sp.]|uniref:hypothetical protein n=1 Tax=Lactobacillus sp. TaxID=1591 RepID=UPI001989117E|nr:hypothetical protein [Lactobacillus sp.]MBD5430461.1 hypothetical protein [Lactobacillus sp.]MBD5430590.1 hypothetical protein [Lactobacillus sp.]
MEWKRGENIETLGLDKIQNKKAGRSRDRVAFDSLRDTDFNSPLQVEVMARWGG